MIKEISAKESRAAPGCFVWDKSASSYFHFFNYKRQFSKSFVQEWVFPHKFSSFSFDSKISLFRHLFFKSRWLLSHSILSDLVFQLMFQCQLLRQRSQNKVQGLKRREKLSHFSWIYQFLSKEWDIKVIISFRFHIAKNRNTKVQICSKIKINWFSKI